MAMCLCPFYFGLLRFVLNVFKYSIQYHGFCNVSDLNLCLRFFFFFFFFFFFATITNCDTPTPPLFTDMESNLYW